MTDEAEARLRPVSTSVNQEDIQSKSAPEQRVGLIINNQETIESETEIIPDKRKIEKLVNRQRYSPVEFHINEQDGRLAIRFTGHFDNAWIDEIRSFGRYYYDKVTKEFLLPWSVLTVDSMSDYFSSRDRALPKVFSKEEVQRILNATRNTKHKLLLWIIYSCGLRRSEITNVKLTDLDRDRSVLHIKEGN